MVTAIGVPIAADALFETKFVRSTEAVVAQRGMARLQRSAHHHMPV